jgi:SagB-type dehydrogenase family enzyme
MSLIKPEREFLKSDRWEEWRHSDYDQKRHVPRPPLEKPAPTGALQIELPAVETLAVGQISVCQAIRQRRSQRSFSTEPLILEELTFLLWATQGISGGKNTLRSVPSGGACHPFETYLSIQRVANLEPGLYRYLAIEHRLCLLRAEPEIAAQIAAACSQNFAGDSAVTFVWTAIPYRTEWRYSFLAPKLIALDAGHVCQNLYLACEAIGAGTCAMDAYDQNQMDAFLSVDGEDEFTVYMAPVGKIKLEE